MYSLLPKNVIPKMNGINVVKNQHQDDCNRERRFSNSFEIGYNAFEFVLEFCQRYGEEDEAPCHTGIVTSPVYAKALLEILQQAIQQYEQSFGTIDTEPNVSIDGPAGKDSKGLL